IKPLARIKNLRERLSNISHDIFSLLYGFHLPPPKFPPLCRLGGTNARRKGGGAIVSGGAAP
ncbi:MAG: hypothetical protein AAFR05_13600, partial [Bacteroidota bacterium]